MPQFRFEIPATLYFTVQADSAEQGKKEADRVATEVLGDHDLNFPEEHEVWLDLDDQAPNFLGQVEDDSAEDSEASK